MTNAILKRISDEKQLAGDVCGRCARWGNEHTDEGRPVYTLKCDNGEFTPMWGSCPNFIEG